MNTTNTEANGPFDELRAQVRAVMEADKLSQADVARMVDVAYGTLTPFMGGTYRGDNAKIAEKVTRWLATRRSASATADILQKTPGFVETPTAAEVTAVLQFAHAAPDFGVIVGGSGIGKTTAIEEYQRVNSNVWIWTAEPAMEKTNKMLVEIAGVLGLDQRQSSLVSPAIVRRLRNASALLVVDEAQHLETKALDQLRTIHDKAGCGVVVSGNESLLARLRGGAGASDTAYAQLYGRTGMRIARPNAQNGDIVAMLDAWGVSDEPTRKVLAQIGRKPGALRVMGKVIRLAGMMARSGGEPLGVAHVRSAFAQLSSLSLDTAA